MCTRLHVSYFIKVLYRNTRFSRLVGHAMSAHPPNQTTNVPTTVWEGDPSEGCRAKEKSNSAGSLHFTPLPVLKVLGDRESCK